MLGRRWLVTSLLLFGCGSESSADDGAAGSESTTSSEAGTSETETGEPPEDPMLSAEDFGCILDWPKVHRFRITNVLGDVDASVAVANSPDGGSYPIGTLIQLIPV